MGSTKIKHLFYNISRFVVLHPPKSSGKCLITFEGCRMPILSKTLEKKDKKIRQDKKVKRVALAGNRTRASRVAGENSTTEPPVLR